MSDMPEIWKTSVASGIRDLDQSRLFPGLQGATPYRDSIARVRMKTEGCNTSPTCVRPVFCSIYPTSLLITDAALKLVYEHDWWYAAIFVRSMFLNRVS